MKRTPAVAGQFYPGSSAALSQTIQHLSPHPSCDNKQKAKAIVSPHAGYIYSGGVAAETFDRVKIPENVIVIGPNHHGAGAKLAVYPSGSWELPFGEVPINENIGAELATGSIFAQDTVAHMREHSLEVQVPFIQHCSSGPTSIVPICVSYISYDDCQKAGEKLAQVIAEHDGDILMVASTDMSHYESRQEATRKDNMAIKHMLDFDPAGLYQTVIGNRISMCGVIPTTITLIAAKQLGATSVELVRYTDSGEASGNTSQVVGYAGLVVN